MVWGIPSFLNPRHYTASQHQAQNARRSIIYRLPPELLHQVLDYLSGADHQSFRICCRNMYLLSYAAPCQDSTLDEKKALTTRLRRDDFSMLCKREVGLLKPIITWKRLLCGSCQTSHPRDSFSQGERGKHGSKRGCIGARGRLRLCPDMSLTYQELQDQLRDNSIVSCQESCLKAHPGYSSMIVQTPWMRGMTDVECQTEMTILENVGEEKSIATEEVAEALCSMDHPICPHVRTSSEAVRQRLFKDAVTRQNIHGHEGLWEEKGFTECWCPKRECWTRISTERSEGRFVLKVRRKLGMLSSAADPSWRVQLVVDEP